jgi:hypothetical protein
MPCKAMALSPKCNDVADLRDWLAEVKHLDDKKRFECQQAIKAFEQSAAASRTTSRTSNNSQNITQNNTLTGPSHQGNTFPTPAATSSPSTTATKPDYPPKLTEEEKALLLKYDGCLKCCKPFVYHKGSDKAPGCSFPVGSGYKPLTYVVVNGAMPPNYKARVASVVLASTSDAAGPNAHPVATIFPGITNPIDYLAMNTSSILGGFGDSDTSVSENSFPDAVTATIDSVNSPFLSFTNDADDATAAFSVPHLSSSGRPLPLCPMPF